MKATPSDASPPESSPPEAAATPVPAPDATPTPTAKPATWPEWFVAVDLALGIMVLILAFLAASYVARNSDAWLHLATGRLIAEGNYTPGADPYSFAKEGRVWADTSWLYSLGSYALYKADPTGATLVAVKAVMFAVAFGLLVLLRRPGHALWPWTIVATLGILSAAFYTPLRPVAVSVLFLSITLVILFRMPWRPGSWREPGLLAGLFALWANLDQWFMLGPLTVALVLLGEKLNVFMARGEDPIAADDPFPPAPPTQGLLRALAIGTAACLLNPMVLAAIVKDPGEAVVQLVPWELGFQTPAGAAEDSELMVMTYKPLRLFEDQPNEFLWLLRTDLSEEAIKWNAIAYYALAVVTLIALVVGIARLRATHLVLVIAFAVLSLTHVRLLPFFAIAAVPIAAMYLNLLSKRVRLTTWADLGTRFALGGSALGRVLCVVIALLLIGASYPGWLHPPVREKALANRLAWGLEGDPGLERAAKELHRLRTEAGLPAEARGIATSPLFGDYCAWHVPGEKVYTTTRYGFHRSDLPDLLALRREMVGRRNQGAAQLDMSGVARLCEARGATFLAVTSNHKALDTVGVFQLVQTDPRWDFWHLDGRSAIVGRPAPTESAAFAKFRYDPIRVAFAPSAGNTPPDPVLMPLANPEDGWDAFLTEYLERPRVPTPDMDDAFIMIGYSYLQAERANGRTQQRIMMGQRGGVVASPVAAVVWVSLYAAEAETDEQIVVPLLGIRAARRAVAADPDRAEVYQTLARAYRHPLVPTLNAPLRLVGLPEKNLQIMTAAARYLARVPGPDKVTQFQATQILQECLQLAETYAQTGQLDFALLLYKKALPYARPLPPDVLWGLNPRTARRAPTDAKEVENEKANFLKFVEGLTDKLERTVDVATGKLSRQTRPAERFFAAIQEGLPGLALKQFRDTPLTEYGAARDSVVIQAIALEFRAGHLERGVADLNDLDADLKKLYANDPFSRKAIDFRSLQEVRARLEGNATALAELLDQAVMQTVAPDFQPFVAGAPFLTIADRAAAAPKVLEPLAALAGTHVVLLQPWDIARVAVLAEAMYHYDRGLQDLLNGNVAASRRRFELAAKPQGVPIERVGGSTSDVQRYLDLLRRAEAMRK